MYQRVKKKMYLALDLY